MATATLHDGRGWEKEATTLMLSKTCVGFQDTVAYVCVEVIIVSVMFRRKYPPGNYL